jgi:hypothetical protein
MEKYVSMSRIHVFISVFFAAFCACAEVTCNITEIEFPTYGFSDPDPVPRTQSPLYPYFRFDGSAAKSSLKK